MDNNIYPYTFLLTSKNFTIMKKNLFFISVAVLALSSCNNDTVVDENPAANQPKEITFQAIATPTTRAAVTGTTFPEAQTIAVAAYDATAGANYFASTDFSNVESTTTWTGSKYWPFTAATINFLAYAKYSNVAGTFNATNYASEVTLVLTDNATTQSDVMYAAGTGTVSQSGNGLTFPTNVPMTFKHAQAWIQFSVKAGDATSASKITVNNITLNGVSCNGTYTVTYSNYDATSTPSVAGAWSEYGTGGSVLANKSLTGALTITKQEFGNLLVVPAQGIESFTINYTLDGNTYDYTYTPAASTLAQATKYIYDITLTVHEIVIAPTVADWTAETAVAVGI